MQKQWVRTDETCPECGSERTSKYPSTGALYCAECERDYLPSESRRLQTKES